MRVFTDSKGTAYLARLDRAAPFIRSRLKETIGSPGLRTIPTVGYLYYNSGDANQ